MTSYLSSRHHQETWVKDGYILIDKSPLQVAALENLMQGKTVIIIAHRLSTILHAHRIVVMKDGRVVDEGPPAALLESRGVFFELFHLQQQAFAGEQTVSE